MKMKLFQIVAVVIMSICLSSCEKEEFDILKGTWQSTKTEGLMLYITDKGWHSVYTGKYSTERIGTYIYDGFMTITINIEAREGSNGAYTQTLFIKELNENTLILTNDDYTSAGSYKRVSK